VEEKDIIKNTVLQNYNTESMKNISELNRDFIEECHKCTIEANVPVHSWGHILDVIEALDNMLLSGIGESDFSVEVCILACYAHDVGRISRKPRHEKESAIWAKEKLEEMSYPRYISERVYHAIINHRTSGIPKTLEGVIVRDADKLAWLGRQRLKKCLELGEPLPNLMGRLHLWKDQVLKLDVSKELSYDYLVKAINMYSKQIYKDKDSKVKFAFARDELYIGCNVRHFKHEAGSEDKSLYEYKILDTVYSAVTGGIEVLYKELHHCGSSYVRPVEEFISEVDHVKYPDIKQKYRFELI